MNALAIDTSTYVMGVAVIKDGILAGEIMTNLKKNHSVRLMPAIRFLLEEVDMKPKDLDRIIVSQGPGSYTGVRIGVTTGKTLAWSLQIPIVGVSSLEVLAQNGRYFNGYISPFFDARRGQVYTGLYKWENGEIRVVKEDRITLHKDWLEQLKGLEEPVLFLSVDMDKHETLIKDMLGDSCVIGKKNEMVLRPGELAQVGIEREAMENVHDFTPNYLRLAEAEAKWLEKIKGEEK